MVGFALYAHTNNTIYDRIAFFSSSLVSFFSLSFLRCFFNKIIIEWQAMRLRYTKCPEVDGMAIHNTDSTYLAKTS